MRFTKADEISWLVYMSKMRLREDKIVLYKNTGKISTGNGEDLFKLKANFGSRKNGFNRCE